MSGVAITSAQNPRVKAVLRLKQRRERDRTDRFLIEGYRELLRAVDAGVCVRELYFCRDFFLGENEQALLDRVAEAGGCLLSTSKTIFQKLSYRDRPDGLLGVASQLHTNLSQLPLSFSPFLVVAEAIEKPGNLGTILRSCDAASVDGLILCDRCTDIHNPNVVRASVGTLFTVPVVEESKEASLDWLRANRVQVVAATPSAEIEYTQAILTGPVAIALGTEQYGLSDYWMDAADIQVRIPMRGVADSLNVATAAALLLYEVVRQRA